MSHSQFHCSSRVDLDMHGLDFETSICYWQDQPGRLQWVSREDPPFIHTSDGTRRYRGMLATALQPVSAARRGVRGHARLLAAYKAGATQASRDRALLHAQVCTSSPGGGPGKAPSQTHTCQPDMLCAHTAGPPPTPTSVPGAHEACTSWGNRRPAARGGGHHETDRDTTGRTAGYSGVRDRAERKRHPQAPDESAAIDLTPSEVRTGRTSVLLPSTPAMRRPPERTTHRAV